MTKIGIEFQQTDVATETQWLLDGWTKGGTHLTLQEQRLCSSVHDCLNLIKTLEHVEKIILTDQHLCLPGWQQPGPSEGLWLTQYIL